MRLIKGNKGTYFRARNGRPQSLKKIIHNCCKHFKVLQLTFPQFKKKYNISCRTNCLRCFLCLEGARQVCIDNEILIRITPLSENQPLTVSGESHVLIINLLEVAGEGFYHITHSQDTARCDRCSAEVFGDIDEHQCYSVKGTKTSDYALAPAYLEDAHVYNIHVVYDLECFNRDVKTVEGDFVCYEKMIPYAISSCILFDPRGVSKDSDFEKYVTEKFWYHFQKQAMGPDWWYESKEYEYKGHVIQGGCIAYTPDQMHAEHCPTTYHATRDNKVADILLEIMRGLIHDLLGFQDWSTNINIRHTGFNNKRFDEIFITKAKLNSAGTWGLKSLDYRQRGTAILRANIRRHKWGSQENGFEAVLFTVQTQICDIRDFYSVGDDKENPGRSLRQLCDTYQIPVGKTFAPHDLMTDYFNDRTGSIEQVQHNIPKKFFPPDMTDEDYDTFPKTFDLLTDTMEYCTRDTIATAMLVVNFLDTIEKILAPTLDTAHSFDYLNSISGPSMSFRLWRQYLCQAHGGVYSSYVARGHALDTLNTSFIGGRVELAGVGQVTVGEDDLFQSTKIESFDLNSSYPTIMDGFFPGGHPLRLSEENLNKTNFILEGHSKIYLRDLPPLFVLCYIRKPKNPLFYTQFTPVPMRMGESFTGQGHIVNFAGPHLQVLTSYDIVNLHNNKYRVKVLPYIHNVQFEKWERPFTEYISILVKVKEQATDQITKNTAKLLMNSLYGYCVQKLDYQKHQFFSDYNQLLDTLAKNPDQELTSSQGVSWYDEDEMAAPTYVLTSTDHEAIENAKTPRHLGIYVTAGARYILHQMYTALDPQIGHIPMTHRKIVTFYMDTDSCKAGNEHTHKLKHFIDNKKIGGLYNKSNGALRWYIKPEYEVSNKNATSLIVLGKKSYCSLDASDFVECKAKGQRKGDLLSQDFVNAALHGVSRHTTHRNLMKRHLTKTSLFSIHLYEQARRFGCTIDKMTGRRLKPHYDPMSQQIVHIKTYRMYTVHRKYPHFKFVPFYPLTSLPTKMFPQLPRAYVEMRDTECNGYFGKANHRKCVYATRCLLQKAASQRY